MNSSLGGQSRIQNEFEFLEWLGNGTFGSVVKVKHKLDDGVYAIKRIELNPKKTQLNDEKIDREVKLLCKLYHANVVRYHNSWIENGTLDDPSHRSQLTLAATPSSRVAPGRENNRCKLMDLGSADIERLAPPMHDVEWNISYQSRASAVLSADSDGESEDSSSDKESNEDFPPRTRIDSSDSIVFKNTSASQISNFLQGTDELSQREPDNARPFLYIQMEFCEKGTLRAAIDKRLCAEEDRVRRLFKETVRGLYYIHQQDVIHRDLKPGNIFLDSNDHVKIGDFGLATTNILSTLAQTINIDEELQPIGTSFDIEDVGWLTGQVGTALYTAPELSSEVAKAIYNQKVDIYSLGIILFEMWYKPFDTGMERSKVLENLRSRKIILPQEFTDIDMPHQVHLLRWLLNHDPSLRPTAQQLLTSKYLWPPELEKVRLRMMDRYTADRLAELYQYDLDDVYRLLDY